MRILQTALAVILASSGCKKEEPAATADSGVESAPEETGGESPGVDGALEENKEGPCSNASTPEPNAGSGVVTLQIEENVDPCSIEAFVVGYQDTLKSSLSANNEIFIADIPPGEVDIMVTGQLAVTALTTGHVGKRISGTKVLAGKLTALGKVALPAVGSLSGLVKLAGESDHSGVKIYIPGTSFDATSASDGSYKISPYVVEGRANLFFEKDGYHRGQAEDLTIVGGVENKAPPMELVLSTGAEGFILIEGGAQVLKKRAVSIVVGASADAKLMKISESNTFENASWTPLVTRTNYEFNSQGAKTLYIKFADANGLESSPFSDTVEIDLFLSTEGDFEINDGNSISTSRTVGISVSVAENAFETIICEDQSFVGCQWQAAADTYSYTFDTEGVKTLYVQHRDKDGFTSEMRQHTIEVDLFLAGEGGITLAGGVSGIANRTVAVALAVPANAVEMSLCEDSGFSGCGYVPVSASFNRTFDSDGVKTLYVRYRDSDGFVSEVRSATIIVDTAAPIATPSISYTIRSATMNLSTTATDLSPMEIKYAKSADFGSATYQTFSSYLTSIPYSREFKVQLRDSLGHETAEIDLVGSYTHSLSVARCEMGVAYDGTIGVWAGGTSSSYLSAVDIYDFSKNIWVASNLSVARRRVAVALVGGKIIAAGGYDTSFQYRNTVDIYDLASQTWSTSALSSARSNAAAAVWEGKAYIGGGYGGADSNVVDIYDTSTGTWSTATLSVARSSLAAAATNGKVIFAGGGSSNAVDILTVGTGVWTTATLSAGRYDMGVAVHGNLVFFGGGASPASNVVDIYDSQANTWSSTTLSVARQLPAAAAVNGKVIFAGGYLSTTSNVTNVIDVYDVGTQTWSTATMSVARGDAKAIVVGNKIFIAGGQNGSTRYNTVDIYDTETGTVSSSH